MYPALAVLQALEDETALGRQAWAAPASDTAGELSVLWVGSVAGMEQDLVKRAGLTYEAIPAAGVHGVGLRALPRNLLQLARGYRKSRQILASFKPDVLLFTGGYVAVPMALAGHHKPMALYVPDIEPGLALKTLARFADLILLTAEASREFFSRQARTIVTGYPTRPELQKWDIEAARAVLGLQGDLPTLLVFGGSSGARSINQALVGCLPELLAQMQVVHVTGNLGWAETQEKVAHLRQTVSAENFARYKPFAYLHEQMGAAFTAADLVLARAGASTLGEFPVFGLPAVLVPYPHAWRYQQVNAKFLVDRGAAEILADADLKTELLPTLRRLIGDNEQRAKMGQAMQGLAQPQAARSIGQALYNLVYARGGK